MKGFYRSYQRNAVCKFLRGWSVVLLIQFAVSAQAAVEVDGLWFPDFMDINVVSDGMNANGVHMQIWELRSSKSVASAAEYYQRLWKFKPGYLSYDANIWRVVGFVEGNHFVSVQLLKEQVDAFGYLTISKYPESDGEGSRNTSLELPSNSAILSDISAEDGAHISSTVVFKNDLDFKSNLDFFRRHFSAKGWVEDAAPNQVSGNEIMLFRKGPDNATISINSIGNSVTGVGIVVEH